MNETNTSMTSSIFDNYVTSYHFIVISGAILIYSVISLIVFMSAPRIASNIRRLCVNIVLYNIYLHLAFALHNITMDSPRWYFFRITQQSVIFQLIATTAFSVERLVAINSPYIYRKYVKTLYVNVFILFQLILYASIICFNLSTDWKPWRDTIVCWTRTSVHIILTLICLFCSLKALVIFRKTLLTVQSVSTDFQQRMKHVNRGKTILSVCCLLSVLLHMPLAAEYMILTCKVVPSQHIYTVYVISFNTVIDPLIYLWRFRECRLQGLMYLSRFPCFKSLREYTEVKRISIFNIPVPEKRAHVNSQTASRL